MKTIAITGNRSGLGKEIYDLLSKAADGFGNKIYYPIGIDIMDGFDVKNEKDIIHASKQITNLDILINCAGVNKIDYLEDLKARDFDRLINTNARSIFLTAKHFLPQLKESEGTIINITSNAAHMPMTSSLAYNASKAAAEIMTKQLARELFPRHGIKVFGIAPNKLDGTFMSSYIDNRVPELRGWTFDEAKEYQLKGLALGEETPPKAIAEFIEWGIKTDNMKWFHGTIIPFGL